MHHSCAHFELDIVNETRNAVQYSAVLFRTVLYCRLWTPGGGGTPRVTEKWHNPVLGGFRRGKQTMGFQGNDAPFFLGPQPVNLHPPTSLLRSLLHIVSRSTIMPNGIPIEEWKCVKFVIAL